MTDQFSAAPKVVKPKNKYKEQEEEQEEDEIKLIYNNLMWDKRVFRGNTHAALVTLKNVDPQAAKKPMKIQIQQQQPVQIDDNANKRAAIQIFCDQFVQNLTDKPPRYEYGSQTEALAQKPVVRHRMPQKIGVDIQTQIWDNELFDFDYQVEPLLNVLCGRTLQVSRMQVLQEQQISIMINRQEQLILEQKEEQKKIQRMYEAQNKQQIQNMKKIQAFKKEKDKKVKTHKRLFSRVLAKNFMKNIQKNTQDLVQNNGFFRSHLQENIFNLVPTFFYQKTYEISNQTQKLLAQAQKIALQARQSLIKQHAWAKQVQKTRRNQIIFKREEVAGQKLQRKLMKEEQETMKRFIQEQKIQKQKQEEARRLAQQNQQAGQGNNQAQA